MSASSAEFRHYGSWKFGVMCIPLNINPQNSDPLDRICLNFNTWSSMKLTTNDKNLVKIAQGIRLCGAFICRNFGKFSVLGPHTPPLHHLLWNLAWKSQPTTPNFTPIGATCRPCRVKTSKSPPWVTEIPALCAARNAAGNYRLSSSVILYTVYN